MESQIPDLYKFECFTSLNKQIKTVRLKWTILDVYKLSEKETNREISISKADYANDCDEDSKFQLKIKFLGKSFDALEIYYLVPTPVFLNTTLEVVDVSGYRSYKVEKVATKTFGLVQANKWQFLIMMVKYKFSASSQIWLQFEFKINTEYFNIGKIKLNVPKAQLINDLENLLNKSMFSDVTIKSVEGVEFHAHKAVLASRSSVLKAHFEHNTVESLTNIVDSPFETEVLRAVLTYIYTDNVPKMNEMPEILLRASDFYHINGLKHLCEEALHLKLTVENAIETLELANLHTATNLRRLTLEFIHDDNAKLIITSKSWEALQSVALIKSFIEYIANK